MHHTGLKPSLVSAPGKVILFGEHAVVYGVTAVASSVELRTFAKLEIGSDPDLISLSLPDSSSHSFSWKISELRQVFPRQCYQQEFLKNLDAPNYQETLSVIFGLCQGKMPENDLEQTAKKTFLCLFLSLVDIHQIESSVKVTLTSQLPTGAGLGSSAAFCTALVGCFLVSTGKLAPNLALTDCSLSKTDLETVNSWSHLGEQIVHGKCSGIDNSVSCFGGALKYKSAQFTSLDHFPTFRIMLCDTRVSRSTKTLVANVAQKKAKHPLLVEHIFSAIQCISESFLALILNETKSKESSPPIEFHQTISELVEMNHALLLALEVSHPKLELARCTLKTFGLASKLTGAGGGGCCFAILPESFPQSELHRLEATLAQHNIVIYDTLVGTEGIKIHTGGMNCIK
eukprot:Sdes_comp17932_c0_seq1m7188